MDILMILLMNGSIISNKKIEKKFITIFLYFLYYYHLVSESNIFTATLNHDRTTLEPQSYGTQC